MLLSVISAVIHFLSPGPTWRLTEVFQYILKESTMYGREDETGFDTNITLVRRIKSLLVSFVDSYKEAIFLFSNYLLTDLGGSATDGLSAHVTAVWGLTHWMCLISAGWKHHTEVLWDISFSVRTNTYWSCGKHFWHILWYIHHQQQSVVTGVREVWRVGDLQR